MIFAATSLRILGNSNEDNVPFAAHLVVVRSLGARAWKGFGGGGQEVIRSKPEGLKRTSVNNHIDPRGSIKPWHLDASVLMLPPIIPLVHTRQENNPEQ
jgi:hypothetical protein